MRNRCQDKGMLLVSESDTLTSPLWGQMPHIILEALSRLDLWLDSIVDFIFLRYLREYFCNQGLSLSVLAEECHSIRSHPSDFSDHGPMRWWGRLLPCPNRLHIHGQGKKAAPVSGAPRVLRLPSATNIMPDPDLGPYLSSHWCSVERR